jgi:hypothetical protein
MVDDTSMPKRIRAATIETVRLRARLWRAASLAALMLLPGAARAEDTASAASENGYGRILLTLSPQAHVRAQVSGGVLTIRLDRKAALDPEAIAQAVPSYLTHGRADADGKTFRFMLSQPLRTHISASGDKIAIDLMAPSYQGNPPDLPPPPPPPPKAVDIATLEGVKLRVGSYANFTRIVFDWPRNVPYTVFPGAGKLTLRFEAQARPDLSIIDRLQPPWLKNAGWHIEGKSTVVEFQTDADSGYHDFRDGTHVVLDVLAPKTDAAAYDPPGTGKPKPTVLASAAQNPPKAAQTQTATSGVTQAQAKEIADTAAKLAPAPPAQAQATGAPTPLTPAGSNQAAPNQAQPASAAAAATRAPDTAHQSATLVSHGDQVVMTFAGAGARPSAVFERGMSVWIVLEGAAGLDAEKLKASLGTFPAAVEAATGDGASVLRITLKTPQDVSAKAIGDDLRVTIAPHTTDQPTAIGFSRNLEDPKLASLSTLVPGADRALHLVDPVAGDTLLVVPGGVGRAMIAPRAYSEFALLKTASGLVISPFVDDLDVEVMNARVSITRPGGLSLTPSELPAANSPTALARGASNATFLDFASWSDTGSEHFLDAERRLRAEAAAKKPQEALHARLELARLYLANGFAAESLGLLNELQASDPALQSDPQLQLMRGAADYMMGRYKDAHNDLAAGVFDTDRNAALWRGLTETALENFADARVDLMNAEPVLSHYTSEWRARARLAMVDAALGTGALELADAALARLPQNLPKALVIESELARARLYASESRYRAAAPLFEAVEKTGDPKQAAKAIFYHAVAGLAAGANSPHQTINTLEKLRFRWRGDALEMKALRKLGSLYLAAKDWRKGLETLRIATQSFPSDENARQVEDDMRAGFERLYLKGQADALPPVEALALFYDFVELTPIGAQGDEMIRRMSDRLLAIDLLGPAEDLLNYQVTKRLDGVARAQVAARLAMIELMDKKPKQALATLQSTQLSTLPDEVSHRRLLLEARALAALKQWNEALDLIAEDQSPESARLRADIYWESGNWPLAGQKLEQLLDARTDKSAPLSDDERTLLLRDAIAYSMANDQTSLDRLRETFAAKMIGTRDATAFDAVTQRIDLQGAEFRDVAAKIASVDTLQSFMKDFRRRNDGAVATY